MRERKLSRREFFDLAARWGAVLGGSGLLLSSASLRRFVGLEPTAAEAAETLEELIRQAPLARYWVSTSTTGVSCATCHVPSEVDESEFHEHESPVVKCLLCAHGCTIPEGSRGRCRARMNVRGELRTLVYGRPISQHVDPIEKKPFYHFLPGSQAYSLATSGCPLRCKFCQNWEISQARPEDYAVPFCSAENMVQRVVRRRAPVIAYTYNEPTVFTEYLVDIARAGKEQGIRSVLVSCGFMNEAPLTEMLEVLDAVKIDLKGFDPEFYRKVTESRLEPVLRSIKQVARAGRHLELVNLVVPTLNDSEHMLKELAKWMVGELGPDVPVHFTRFHPDFQLLNLPPTPVPTLERAREIAMEQGVRYAFVGNVPGHPGNHTYCPSCGRSVIERTGFFITRTRMKDGQCTHCRTPIAGVWN